MGETRGSASPDEPQNSEWRLMLANWRPLLALICFFGGVFLFVGASILIVFHVAYPPTPQLRGAFQEALLGLAFFIVGSWLFLPERPPFRAALYTYFVMLGLLLFVVPLKNLRFGPLSPADLAVISIGLALGCVGLIISKVGEKRRQDRGRAV